ncbi:hypothetical protein BGZ96_001047 [Linnemannia gamsii]|uniref:Chitin-binding type-1 domain-containing protein n=1 Tax=Linnemannia gamsii TaxID=64522 RepID=A0ABQ7JN64_9FUNG|nr:hypothetical protein BGZ96_001047 [Linnemannia gamsii]
MHRSTTTLIAIILCCLGLLSIVAAQTMCGPTAGSCAEGFCCSSNGFCGQGDAYCGTGCQPFGAPCGPISSAGPTTNAPPTPSVTSIAPSPIPTTETTVLPPTVPATTEPATTTNAASTTTPATSTSARGTFQFQPTGKPSSGSSAGVDSRLALVIVFLAGLFMI